MDRRKECREGRNIGKGGRKTYRDGWKEGKEEYREGRKEGRNIVKGGRKKYRDG